MLDQKIKSEPWYSNNAVDMQPWVWATLPEQDTPVELVSYPWYDESQQQWYVNVRTKVGDPSTMQTVEARSVACFNPSSHDYSRRPKWHYSDDPSVFVYYDELRFYGDYHVYEDGPRMAMEDCRWTNTKAGDCMPTCFVVQTPETPARTMCRIPTTNRTLKEWDCENVTQLFEKVYKFWNGKEIEWPQTVPTASIQIDPEAQARFNAYRNEYRSKR